ncbi:MAG: imidazoleglycerol-phosphate dehydratase HisB [Clostridium perfringens]|nr:imidazoleglycerol-phosphate dehydratase HisB [Clostridium perfringens]
MDRISDINRSTMETSIEIKLNLDGTGKRNIDTGIGFFDHMLNLFAFHSRIDLNIKSIGDLEVDDHHTVEDVGIVLGKALKEALGDKKFIKRYGTFYIPMDETLALVSLDLSGRNYLVFNCDFSRENIGNFSTEMVEEFFRALSNSCGMTLHLKILYGKNDHHKIEALFKAFGRALKEAITIDETLDEVQSSKGVF